MAITTYAELLDAIEDWIVGAGGVEAQNATFVALAEAEFNRRLRTRDMLGRSTALVNTQYTALPADFLEAKNCTAAVGGRGVALLQTTMEKADFHRERRKGGDPAFFVVSGAEMEVVPAPSAACAVELVYYRRIPALSDAAPTNWLLARWPDLYLNCALAHAQPYLANPNLGAWHRAEADRIAEEIRFADANAQLGATPLIARPRRSF